MENEVVAVSGIRRAIRELVDGTIRVQIDIDPRFSADFHRLFGTIDMPVALAPITPDAFERGSRKAEAWKSLGPLAQSAVLICRDTGFQKFVEEVAGYARNEDDAAKYVRERCDVSTRKDIDSIDGAKEKFGSLMAEYREWLH
jgi:hypothetical protein